MLRAAALVLAGLCAAAAAQVQTPSQFLHLPVGADRTLADYGQIAGYFRYLAGHSPRVEIEDLGGTTQGRPFLMAAISTPENLKQAGRYRDIARRLAHPEGLTPARVEALVEAGKPIVLVTCNIHSDEIASSQEAMELAYEWATSTDPVILGRLERMIVLLVPSLNPDGQMIETDWYRKQLGTPYEGTSPPWIYNQYTGHDDNRDWYMLTQRETREMTRAAYKEWYPQVWLDEHQMGASGPRLFVPPYADPIAPSVSPLLWRGINLIGANMAWRLQQAGKSGVVSHYEFDAYYPGSVDSNPEFKNIFGLITEAASARMATPLTLDRSQLVGDAKGLPDYTVASNFPDPWPGGEWRLRDIMEYEHIATDALLETVAADAGDFLRGTARMAEEQIAAGKPGEYWVIPRGGATAGAAADLAAVLDGNAITVLETGGEYLVPTAQAYGKYAAELLGRQRYPEVRADQGGKILAPYDTTAWSLPLMMGVACERRMVADEEARGARPYTIEWRGPQRGPWPRAPLRLRLGWGPLGSPSQPEPRWGRAASFSGGGPPFGISRPFPPTWPTVPTARPTRAAAAARPEAHAVRVGLYKPWTASMDEGWTRFVLERHGYAPRALENARVRAGGLNRDFDAIVLPDLSAASILNGRRDLPAPYAGGIGAEGEAALAEFVRGGGTLVALADSGELAVQALGLRVRNTVARDPGVAIPGTLLRVHLNPAAEINRGMPGLDGRPDAAVFVDSPIAYEAPPAPPGDQLTVLARYPADAQDVLLSGWMTGADQLTDKAAALEYRIGRGRLVLFGFRPQFRAQTEGTFPMLFHALEAGRGEVQGSAK